MAHRYGHPVAVIRAADGTPAYFRWKGSEWPVSEVFETWHLMGRWWVRLVYPATATYSLNHGEQDRTYYRRGCCCWSSALVRVSCIRRCLQTAEGADTGHPCGTAPLLRCHMGKLPS
jgi:uncharacterized protein DUF6504